MSSDGTTNERIGYLMLNNATADEWDAIHRAARDSESSEQTDLFPKDFDIVNKPSHYNSGSIECIDGIRAMLTDEEFIGYLRGNSLKYRWRYPHKNGVEDLKKAEWYENKLLEVLEDVRKKLS